jgi:hypothetical protein
VEWDWNDQVGASEQELVTLNQGTAEMRAQKRKTSELQCVDYLDERWFVGPAGVESLERGWISSTGATEIAIG